MLQADQKKKKTKNCCCDFAKKYQLKISRPNSRSIFFSLQEEACVCSV
jgi:hypothetical protein